MLMKSARAAIMGTALAILPLSIAPAMAQDSTLERVVIAHRGGTGIATDSAPRLPEYTVSFSLI